MKKTLAPVAALLISVSILLTGQGLQGTLLPVRATLENFPALAIGAMGAAYFIGFTMGCLQGGELVRRVGHVRVFLAMGALASASPLIHALIVHPLAWSVLRFMTGFCFAVLYVVIESWLNDRSTNETRGIIFSTYAMITLTVLAIGQMLTLLYDPADLQLFIIASILVSISALLVALSTSPTPEQPSKGTINLRRLFEISPSGALGSLVSGLANGSFWAMAPVFTSSVSSGTALAAWFMTSAVVGGAISQWPLGLLSDRFSRRGVLVSITAGGCAVGFVMSYMAPGLTFLQANLLAAIWGALAFPLYTIAVAYANDRAEIHEYVTVSSGLLLMYGIGAILGPFIASVWVTLRNPGELFMFSAFAHALLAFYIVGRWLRLSRKEPDRAISFSDALATTQTVSHVYEEEELEKNPGQKT